MSGASLGEPPLFQVEFEDPNWAAPDLPYRGYGVNYKSPSGSFSGQTASGARAGLLEQGLALGSPRWLDTGVQNTNGTVGLGLRQLKE